MISVIRVFNAIRDLCNEDQRGFVTPEVFNSFAEIAQEAVYEDMKAEFLVTDRLRKSNADLGGAYSVKRGGLDVMSDYLIEDDFVIGTNDVNEERLIFDKPKDMDRLLSIAVAKQGDSSKQRYCEIVYDIDKVAPILRSNLSTPTEDYPIAIVTSNIEIIPDTMSGVKISHYRRPTSVFVSGENAGEVDRNAFPRYVPRRHLQSQALYFLMRSTPGTLTFPGTSFRILSTRLLA